MEFPPLGVTGSFLAGDRGAGLRVRRIIGGGIIIPCSADGS